MDFDGDDDVVGYRKSDVSLAVVVEWVRIPITEKKDDKGDPNSYYLL